MLNRLVCVVTKHPPISMIWTVGSLLAGTSSISFFLRQSISNCADTSSKAVFPLSKVSTITPATVTLDRDTRQSLLTCLGHLGWCNTDIIASISCPSPKVAKASTVMTVACRCCWRFCFENFANANDPSYHLLFCAKIYNLRIIQAIYITVSSQIVKI